MQLELFHGPHVPLTRCIAALEEGDLRAARQALAGAEPGTKAAADGHRLAAIEVRVPAAGEAGTITAGEVHAAFEAALAPDGPGSAPGEIPAETWFRIYARNVAAALDAGVGQRFRGWYALHFLLAAGWPGAALRSGHRLVATCDRGQAWLEASRAAGAAGEAEQAARWVVFACLKDGAALEATPPSIAAATAPELDPPPGALPHLAPAIGDLWDEVEALDLPGPASAWVPAVGIIDGVFSPSLLGWSVDLEGSGFNPTGPAPAEESPPRAFVRALLAARQARAATPAPARTGCGEAELSARLRMNRLAPKLLGRYLARLGGRPAGLQTRPVDKPRA